MGININIQNKNRQCDHLGKQQLFSPTFMISQLQALGQAYSSRHESIPVEEALYSIKEQLVSSQLSCKYCTVDTSCECVNVIACIVWCQVIHLMSFHSQLPSEHLLELWKFARRKLCGQFTVNFSMSYIQCKWGLQQ